MIKTFAATAVLLTSCLTACVPMEPSMFGMPRSQFLSLTHSQQNMVIESYNQQQIIRAQNEPLNNMVNVAQTAVNQNNNKSNNPPPPPPPPPPPAATTPASTTPTKSVPTPQGTLIKKCKIAGGDKDCSLQE